MSRQKNWFLTFSQKLTNLKLLYQFVQFLSNFVSKKSFFFKIITTQVTNAPAITSLADLAPNGIAFPFAGFFSCVFEKNSGDFEQFLLRNGHILDGSVALSRSCGRPGIVFKISVWQNNWFWWVNNFNRAKN